MDSTAQCSQDEISKRITESWGQVNARRDEVFCGLQHPAPGLGTQPPVVQGSAPDGLNIWLQYVAEHIRTNTPFDSSYSRVAVNALDVSGTVDPTGDRCLNLHPGHDVFSDPVSADPADVGRSLFRQFSVCDARTRQTVAQQLQSLPSPFRGRRGEPGFSRPARQSFLSSDFSVF